MKETYIIKVDRICDYCGYHNKIQTALPEPIEIIACGKCGNFIMIPDDFPESDKELLSKMLDKAIEEMQ